MLLDHFTSHFLQESRALFFSFLVFTGIKSSLSLSFEQTERTQLGFKYIFTQS